ncbi:hypothetical protein MAM1_0012d01255 [Mucor ambiguus]|uniref:Uncharacterized protein n=1 Tax=Mucor ambiguus TaxID=91626 RepID=A0A0C9LR02_9FUNG|nr:hypothetical protein MAM1_0012d01255 [Mucor ambiguus]
MVNGFGFIESLLVDLRNTNKLYQVSNENSMAKIISSQCRTKTTQIKSWITGVIEKDDDDDYEVDDGDSGRYNEYDNDNDEFDETDDDDLCSSCPLFKQKLPPFS